MHVQNNGKNFIWSYAVRLLACVAFGVILVAHSNILIVHAENSDLFSGTTKVSVMNGDSAVSERVINFSVVSKESGLTIITPYYISNGAYGNKYSKTRSIFLSDKPFVINIDGVDYDSAYKDNYNVYFLGTYIIDPGGYPWEHVVSGCGVLNLSGVLGDISDNSLLNYLFSTYEFNFSRDNMREGDFSTEMPFDFSASHDFTADVYDTSIPVPELSNLGYDCFTVDNADENLYLDLYVTSSFYGVLHGDKNSDYYYIDKSTVVNTHRYNMTNYDVAYNDSEWVIPTMFSGVDIVGDLCTDFQTWSNRYPSHKNLPDYSFIKHGSSEWADAYLTHVLQSDRVEFEMKRSKQAVVTYYCRFMKMENGELKYGKWVSYTYQYLSQNERNISIGDVAATSTGEPKTINEVYGTQDENGGFAYGQSNSLRPTYSYEEQNAINLSSLQRSVQGIKDFILEFPDLMEQYSNFSRFLVATFAFIPPSIWLVINMAFQLFLAMLALRILMKFL